jgi:archaellum component FlaF (FlaF/FlaG flagellin family)
MFNASCVLGGQVEVTIAKFYGHNQEQKEKEQKLIYKTLHRKLKIAKHDPHR